MKVINYFIFVITICLALIIEATFFSSFKLFGANPNLILVIVISLSFFLEDKTTLIFAGIAGLLEDLYIGSMIGSNLLALVLTVYFVKTYSGRIIRENIITPLIIVFISSITYYFLMASFLFIAGRGYLLNIDYIQQLIFGSVSNILLAIIVYPVSYLILHKYKGEI